MKAEVIVTTLWDKNIPDYKAEKGTVVVSTVSKSTEAWERQLSPFLLGPCKLYKGFVSKNMENAWQYSKVYSEHTKTKPMFHNGLRCKGLLTVIDKNLYKPWACQGWANPNAVRYPMGKGRKPEFSYWDGEYLSYVEARKAIYGPLYAEAVKKTEAFARLRRMMRTQKRIVLLDFDARDITVTGETLTDVLNREDKKMGHAFVLAMLLTKDKALTKMELR